MGPSWGRFMVRWGGRRIPPPVSGAQSLLPLALPSTPPLPLSQHLAAENLSPVPDWVCLGAGRGGRGTCHTCVSQVLVESPKSSASSPLKGLRLPSPFCSFNTVILQQENESFWREFDSTSGKGSCLKETP